MPTLPTKDRNFFLNEHFWARFLLYESTIDSRIPLLLVVFPRGANSKDDKVVGMIFLYIMLDVLKTAS